MEVARNDWDTELEMRGAAAVTALLANGHAVGSGRGAEFKLFVSGMENPSRGYVEDWLGRKEAAKAAREEARFAATRRLAKIALVVAVCSLLVSVIGNVALKLL